MIGYAFPVWGTRTVRVARDEIRSWEPAAPPIRIVYDSIVQGDPADVEVERAQRMVETPGLVGVVGHGGSRGSLAAAPVYNAAEIPQIVPTGTSRLLADAGRWTFALAPNDSVEGAFMGRFIDERLGARSVSVFFVNDEYGEGLRQAVATELDRRGIEILDQIPVNPNTDFEAVVDASLQRALPDVIVSAARHVATGRIARIARTHAPAIRVVAGDGALFLPALVEIAGAAAASIHVVAFWLPDASDPAARAFVRRYRRIVGEPPVSADAMSHDALMLLAHAAREVGPDPPGIRDYLLELGRNRPPYRGVTGPISFTPDRPTNLIMARLEDGRPVRAEAP